MQKVDISHKNKILAKQVAVYKNIFLRSLGLRFSRDRNKALILASEKESIHETTIDMYFVFSPIDVLWLDSDHNVVDIRKKVKPFTGPTKPRKEAKFVVELPEGRIENVKLGDKIILLNNQESKKQYKVF